MTLVFDEATMQRLVYERKPQRVVFNAPDGLLSLTREAAKRLESQNPGLHTIIIADPTYGSCDTVDNDALRLGADLAFHMGHNVILSKFGKITHSIDIYDDVSFEEVVEKAARLFKEKNFNSIGLVTFAQHLQQIEFARNRFESEGITAIVGKGMGQLHDGQIFGCEFYPAFTIRDKVGAMALLGQSMFHGIGLCLSTGKPTYILDPYSSEVVDVQKTADERLKRSILAVYKAREASSFGVIIGLKEGQIMPDQSLMIKKKLESLGKKVQLVALREVTPDRIEMFTDIEAFIQTGCPRLSVDGYTFSKPILSVPQTDALINLLSGREVSAALFERKHWL